MSDLTYRQAWAAINAVIAKAQDLGVTSNVAVVDSGCNLKAFARMDGAFLGSIDVAIRKARTARLFDMPTGDIGQLSQSGGPLFSIEQSNGGLITFAGGVPIKCGQEIIGAVGVSGSTVENDGMLAEVAAEAAAR